MARDVSELKLLMITRKVSPADPQMGFAYRWVQKIGERIQELLVITWQKSEARELPNNIKVISLPSNKFLKVIYLQKELLKNLSKVDGVFCHMNPEYTILAAPLTKLFGKKVISWYTHGKVTLRMRLLDKLANKILTASAESFRLPSKKVIVAGHGIDTELFKPTTFQKSSSDFIILSIGRISPIKNYEIMIEVVSILSKEFNSVKLKIIGEIGLARHQNYFLKLKKLVSQKGLSDKIEFLGARPQVEIPHYLQQADIFLNLSDTGSLDKAVLEAMACGCLVFTSNEAFKNVLLPELLVSKRPLEIASKITWLRQQPAKKLPEIKNALRQEVINNHNLNKLVEKILAQFI